MPFYLTPKQDDSNQELQVCIAEAGGQERPRHAALAYSEASHRATGVSSGHKKTGVAV